MNRIAIVTLVLFVTVTKADEKNHKYTQVMQPASRQLPSSHDGYQSDGMYPQQNVQYQMAYQPSNEGIYPSNEGIYPPAVEEGVSDTQAHQPEQPLDNPSYDPNIHTDFRDNINSYVSPYGGPYPPSAVGYPLPYGGSYGPGGFGVQTGVEGYLVPQYPFQPPPPIPTPPGYPGAGFLDIFRNSLPYSRTIMSMLMRSGTYLLSSFGVILFGGAVTTAICSFTPLCTITFAALPFLGLRESLTTKTIKESIANEITSDRVRRAAEFVRTALEKYNQINQIQEEISKEPKNDVSSSAGAKKVSETN